VLVQISVAKRLRDEAEQQARQEGAATVLATHVASAGEALGMTLEQREPA